MAYYRTCRGDAFHPGGYALTRHGVSLCSFAPGDRVCDVGCGTGSNIDRLKADFRLEVAGVEPSPEMRGARTDIIPADAAHTTLPGGSVDGVLCECVWSLCGDAAGTLRELYRILKPGGRLLLSDVYSREGDAEGQGAFGHFFTLERVRQLVRQAGFEIAVVEDHTKELITLAAQLMMDGALENGSGDCLLPPVKCGYFLMVAGKQQRMAREGQNRKGASR